MARLWFNSSRLWLDEDFQVEAIMDDRYKETRAAANAMRT